jgi:hypothetical protein
MRLPGRMLPGRGAGPLTGQSESSGLPTSPKAGWRSADLGPINAPGARRRDVSGAAGVSATVRVAGLLVVGATGRRVVSITVARRADARESTVSAGARDAAARAAASSRCEEASASPARRVPSAHAREAARPLTRVASRTINPARARGSMTGRMSDGWDGRRDSTIARGRAARRARAMDDGRLRAEFKGSPVKRAKL